MSKQTIHWRINYLFGYCEVKLFSICLFTTFPKIEESVSAEIEKPQDPEYQNQPASNPLLGPVAFLRRWICRGPNTGVQTGMQCGWQRLYLRVQCQDRALDYSSGESESNHRIANPSVCDAEQLSGSRVCQDQWIPDECLFSCLPHHKEIGWCVKSLDGGVRQGTAGRKDRHQYINIHLGKSELLATPGWKDADGINVHTCTVLEGCYHWENHTVGFQRGTHLQ